jgi:hypothetical protein
MTNPRLLDARDLIVVTRDDHETVYEATVRMVYPASRATHWHPPEAAEYEIDEVWRTVGDGPAIKLRPDNLPDDVYDQIITIAER